ncbi:MAG TPA: type II toxin-antitoxin system VapC family toxin [Puia sp.]
MRRYLLDTGILVHYARQSQLYQEIETKEKLSEPDCMPLISVVVYGEILSFGMQNNWGAKKLQSISTLLSKLIIIDINSGDSDLLRAYAEIDAFSKGKLPGQSLGTSAIIMGKNDLWIAATAKVANASLITVDSDFNHLNEKFIQVRKY